MKITIPVAGVELQGVASQAVIYPKQLPVWPTRPMMIKIYPDKISGVGQTVTVAVANQGIAVHTFELPYEDVIDFDISFVCPLMTRADRQKSTELIAESGLLFLCNTSAGIQIIALGVFHCDLTYWHTIPGNQASLPEPPKIKMPGQDVDIYYPFATASGVTFPVVAEPADDADPTAAIMPTVYELGKTLDVRYLKKLTIKDVWGEGLDHVIEYENRNWNHANEDDALLCALRVRWNMQNGEWFWDAFKNFFWSNNFTYLRGLGGATEQAEVTVNMEYGPDKYAVYQQLMISSQIIMELNMPGINQYQYKVFRAEVVSDSGARWSGSTRTYRQQVRFRTRELQDNYISPVLPDSPAVIPVQFSASPLTMTSFPYYADINAPLNVNSNVFWDIVPESDWLIINSPENGRGKPGVSQAVTSRRVNPSTTGRIGYMHIYRAGTTTKLATVNVSQNGAPAVNATPKFLPVSSEGELKPFTVSCATAGHGALQVKNMSGVAGAWVNLDASSLDQDGGSVKVNPARNLPETGGVPRSCIIRTTHNITGQFADVNVMQSVACPVDRFPNDFAWEGKGMFAYDGNAHDDIFAFTSGIPYTDMVAECNQSYVTNIKITRATPHIRLAFSLAQNLGEDRFARIKVKHVPTGKAIVTLVLFQRAYSGSPANFVHASWDPAEAADGSMHYFELITAASEVPAMSPPSQMYLHNIDSLTVNGVRLNKFRVMLDWCLFTRSLQIGMSVTGASKTISIGQFANADAMTISTNTHWNRLAPVWVIGKDSLTFNVDVQAQKLNQRDEISFFRLDSWISLQSTEAHQGNPYVRRFTINLAANTTGAARGTEIRFQRPELTDIIIRIEQTG
jgi:hypothetical protein